MQRLRWSDLSPRAIYEFTVSDAFLSLPQLVAMAGFFLSGLLVMWILKKLLEFFLLILPGNEDRSVYAVDAYKKTERHWTYLTSSRAGNWFHLIIETVFISGVFVVCLFTGAIGNVKIWESPVAVASLSIVISYIFAPGLNQMGAGFFCFLFTMMPHNQYWEMTSGELGGFVKSATPIYVELESIHPHTKTALVVRVPMVTVIAATWQRNIHKEVHTRRVLSTYKPREYADIIVDLKKQ